MPGRKTDEQGKQSTKTSIAKLLLVFKGNDRKIRTWKWINEGYTNSQERKEKKRNRNRRDDHLVKESDAEVIRKEGIEPKPEARRGIEADALSVGAPAMVHL